MILTMDTKEPVSLSHQFRKAIRQFSSDADITEEHLDLVKSEMFGEFFSSMNSWNLCNSIRSDGLRRNNF